MQIPQIQRKRLWFVAVAVVALAASDIAATRILTRASEGKLYNDVASIPHRRVGLVLGCSRRLPDGRDNVFFLNRIDAASRLYAAGKVDYLLVSGDNHSVGYNESRDMKQALIDAGVPADRVYCDYAGFRTLDSIVRAKEVFGQTDLTIVSQEFHNRRAVFLAIHNGIDAIGFNARDVTVTGSIRTRLRDQWSKVVNVLDVFLLHTRPKYLGPRVTIG